MLEIIAKESNLANQPAYFQRAFAEALPQALTILTERYDIPAGKELKKVVIGYRRSFFYPPEAGGPMIKVSKHTLLSTYKRKTLGEWLPRTKVDLVCALACKLVHELTHWIQWIEGRKYSEVETTENELALIRRYHPFWAKKIKKL